LAFKLCIVKEKLAIVAGKHREFYVPFRKLAPRDREQAERQNRTIKRGELYHICMYAVREASQGEEIRLNIKKFLKGKEEGSRAFAHAVLAGRWARPFRKRPKSRSKEGNGA
jgi:hypothetical protein